MSTENQNFCKVPGKFIEEVYKGMKVDISFPGHQSPVRIKVIDWNEIEIQVEVLKVQSYENPGPSYKISKGDKIPLSKNSLSLFFKTATTPMTKEQMDDLKRRM